MVAHFCDQNILTYRKKKNEGSREEPLRAQERNHWRHKTQKKTLLLRTIERTLPLRTLNMMLSLRSLRRILSLRILEDSKENPITKKPKENTITEELKEDLIIENHKENSVTEDSKENLITDALKELQDPQWLLRNLFLAFWWWYMTERVMRIIFHIRILVLVGLVFVLQPLKNRS